MENREFSNGFIMSFLTEKRFRFARHAFFLIGFFLLLYFGDFFKEFPKTIAYYVVFLVYSIFIAMFYLNMYLLIPTFLFKNRYILYFIFLIILVLIGLNIIEWCYGNYFNSHRLIPLNSIRRTDNYYTIFLLCASFISLSTTIKLLQNWIKDKERIVGLKSLTHTMELNELKNQISPHFLFNMLNNVKSLIRIEPEKATTVIMKLSEFLRYQLYESNQERVVLASEIEFILNFLNLEKIRKENLTIHFNCKLDKNSMNAIFIPSGLFTVFVENAIKYSYDINEAESYIKLTINVDDEKLFFSCTNSKSVDFSTYKNKSGGLGLANIKRRLDLIYPDRHKLKITSEENLFHVNLIIPI
ncbi:sensor histidine kinase [Myroides odoratimimus]|uniref:sensor histidine kinase n=1 Tax=Myroides odoratimimus TaxID=76832 RepID=UPI0031018B68